MLRDSIQGDLHQAHSYLFKNGIHAITLRGVKSRMNDKNENGYGK
jgi:hypothetical protein